MQFAVNRHSAYRVPGVLLAVAVLFAIGCDRFSDDIPTGPPIDTDGLVVQGWNQFNNGQYQDAVDSFNEASHVDAKSLEAYLGMGYAFAQLGELGRATQNFNNVLGLTQVLIDEGSITVDQAKQLRAEAHVGHASVELADRDWDDAIAYTDSALTLETDFQHRKIATLNAFQVKLLKAEACFGKTDYATCMDILDAIAPGGFIAGSAQVTESTDTLVVTLLEDTWATGIAEIELPNPNLIKPINILALTPGNEQLDNELFDSWTAGVPDDWTITNDSPGVRYVEEVDSSDVGDAIGTGGAVRFYNYSGADEVLALSQDNLPAAGSYTRVLLNVKAYIAGEMRVLEETICLDPLMTAVFSSTILPPLIIQL